MYGSVGLDKKSCREIRKVPLEIKIQPWRPRNQPSVHQKLWPPIIFPPIFALNAIIPFSEDSDLCLKVKAINIVDLIFSLLYHSKHMGLILWFHNHKFFNICLLTAAIRHFWISVRIRTIVKKGYDKYCRVTFFSILLKMFRNWLLRCILTDV